MDPSEIEVVPAEEQQSQQSYQYRAPSNPTAVEAISRVTVAADAPVHITVIGGVVVVATAVTWDMIISNYNRGVASIWTDTHENEKLTMAELF